MRYDLVIQAQRAILPQGEVSCAVAVLDGRIVGATRMPSSTRRTQRTAANTDSLAWGGISSLQLGLPAIWTDASRCGHTLRDVVRWMAERPAAQAGPRHKGSIAIGNDADFAVFAPAETMVVDPAMLHHKSAVTPYKGRELAGRVRRTVLRGVGIRADVETNGDRHGRLPKRGEA